MHVDRPLLGIFLMLCFCLLAPMGDAMAKLLGAIVPLGTLLLVRFATQAVLLIPIVTATGRPWRMSGRILLIAWARAMLHILGIGAMFTALKYLPIADAVAIAFVMPFIMLLLGWAILGEEVGHRRIIACLVGFIGTLLVIQPSFEEVGALALWPLVVAVVFSFFILATRAIAKETDPIGLQAVNGVMATVVLIPVVIYGSYAGIDGLEWSLPAVSDYPLLFGIGVLGTMAHLMMTWSLRYAPAATLAPMQYLEIPFATIIGWLVFSDWPNGIAAIGICITIAAGLYIVFRERTMSRVAPAAP